MKFILLLLLIIMISCDNDTQRRFDINNSPVHEVKVDGNTIFNDKIMIDISALSVIDESGGGEGDEDPETGEDYTGFSVECNRLDNLAITSLSVNAKLYFYHGGSQTVNLNSNNNYVSYDRNDAISKIEYTVTCYSATYSYTWEAHYRSYSSESIASLNHTGYFYENN